MKLNSSISYVSVNKASRVLGQFIIHNRVLNYETVSVRDCYKRVLAENIVADKNIPAFDTSHMDGYAVKADDINYASKQSPVVLRVKQEKIQPMKAVPPDYIIQRLEAFRISTGGYLPRGANTVVPLEDTQTSTRKNEVQIVRVLPAGSFVYPKGRDVKKDHKVLKRGRILRPQDIGLLESLYITKINVFRRPRIAIISTGSELTSSRKSVKSGKILEKHSGIISKLVEEVGGIPLRMGIVPDDLTKIRKKVEQAISRSTDLILTLGGSSIGEHDLVEAAIKSMGVPQIFFHGIKLDRGRVTGVAISKGRPIIIMPGPIQGAINAFIVFACPIIKLLSGQCLGKPITLNARLGQEWVARKRFPNFLKVVYVHLRNKGNGEYEADFVPGDTETLTTFTRSNGYIIVDEKTTCIKPGARVKVNLLPGLSYVNGQLEI
jgi:molybdenum cofactor synthesis domain-containing protein